MKKLLIIVAALVLFGCKDKTTDTTAQSDITLSGSLRAIKGPCFSGSVTIQPVSCTTLKEVGTATNYNLDSSDIINYVQTQPTNCGAVSGALSCYSELTGSPTSGTVDLFAYRDFTNTNQFTVNVLSRAVQKCVAAKVASGMTVSQAQASAKDAMLSSLGLPANSTFGSFGELNFNSSTQANEILIIMSAVFQKWGNDSGADINSAIVQVLNDFSDCSLTPETLATIRSHANSVNYVYVTSKINSIYTNKFGVSSSQPASSGLINYLQDSDGDGVLNVNDNNNPTAFAFASTTTASLGVNSSSFIVSGIGSGKSKMTSTCSTLKVNDVEASSGDLVKDGDVVKAEFSVSKFPSSNSCSVTIGDKTATYSASTKTPAVKFDAYSVTDTSVTSSMSYWIVPFTPIADVSFSFVSAKYGLLDSKVYSDNAGSLGSLLYSSTSSGSFLDLTIGGDSVYPSSYILTAGTKYWIKLKFNNSGSFTIPYKTDSMNQAKYSYDGINWVGINGALPVRFLD